MSDLENRRSADNARKAFATRPLKAAATSLFNALGYASKKTLDLKPNGLEGFFAMFDPDGRFNRKQALGGDWLESELVFQLAAEDVSAAGQNSLALSRGRVDYAIIEFYLVFALRLKDPNCTRTQLAGIAREINKLLSLPAMLLFWNGDSLTLPVVNHRLDKLSVEHQLLPRQAAPRHLLPDRDINCLDNFLEQLQTLGVQQEREFVAFNTEHRLVNRILLSADGKKYLRVTDIAEKPFCFTA